MGNHKPPRRFFFCLQDRATLFASRLRVAAVQAAIAGTSPTTVIIPPTVAVATLVSSSAVATVTTTRETTRSTSSAFTPVPREVYAKTTAIDFSLLELRFGLDGGFDVEKVSMRETTGLAGGTVFRFNVSIQG